MRSASALGKQTRPQSGSDDYRARPDNRHNQRQFDVQQFVFF